MRAPALLTRSAAIALVATSLLAISAVPAAATTTEEPNGVQITMSPTSVDLEMTPGSIVDDEMVVINSGTEPIRFTVYAQPYSVVNEEYEPDFTTESTRTQIARWVTFETSSYSAEPGDEIAVPYRITIPDDVPDGGQYAVLFAETDPEEDASGVATTRRVGMLVYASVPGTTRESGSVVRAPVGFWQTTDPLVVSETVANDGNTDFAVTTRYRLLDLFGGVAAEQEQTRPVLPETERRIEMELDTAPFGIYTLERSTALPGGDEVESQTIVVVHPVLATILGVVLFLVAAPVILLVLRRRRRTRSAP